jgi:hypothetical protein
MPRARASGALRLRASLEVLDIRIPKPHERTRPGLLSQLIEEIERDGVLKVPVLLEREHLVILDGHHRWEALRRLGCKRIPAYVVDYSSEEISVTTWPGAIVATVTKEEVVAHGVKGDLFPPKTTRHLLRKKLPESPVPLKDLM